MASVRTNTSDSRATERTLQRVLSSLELTRDALGDLTVSLAEGTFPADYPDAATYARLGTILGVLQGTLSVNVGLTDAELRAADVPVSLAGETVTVDDGHPDPQQDALTNVELRAEDVPVAISKRRTLFDYGARTDTNPVYIGFNDQGVAESAASWQIMRLTYDGSDRSTDIQILTGAWDDRASLAWT